MLNRPALAMSLFFCFLLSLFSVLLTSFSEAFNSCLLLLRSPSTSVIVVGITGAATEEVTAAPSAIEPTQVAAAPSCAPSAMEPMEVTVGSLLAQQQGFSSLQIKSEPLNSHAQLQPAQLFPHWTNAGQAPEKRLHYLDCNTVLFSDLRNVLSLYLHSKLRVNSKEYVLFVQRCLGHRDAIWDCVGKLSCTFGSKPSAWRSLVKRLIFPWSSAQMAWKALAQERACSQAGTLKKIWKNKALVTSWPSARSFWSSPAKKALKALKQKTSATWSWGVGPVGTQAIKSCKLRAFCSTDCVMWHGARSMVRVGWQNCCQGLKAAASTSKISHKTGSPWGRPLQELIGYAMSPSTTQSRGPVQTCASVATTV